MTGGVRDVSGPGLSHHKEDRGARERRGNRLRYRTAPCSRFRSDERIWSHGVSSQPAGKLKHSLKYSARIAFKEFDCKLIIAPRGVSTPPGIPPIRR